MTIKNILSILIILLFNSSIFSQDVISTEGMVASAHPLASKVGTKILKEGGNAVDAAVATAFALAVVEPNASGLGGGGYLVIKMTNQEEPVFLDYREMAPAAATPRLYYNQTSNFEDISKLGGKSIGIPGMVAGLLSVHNKFGQLTIEKVLKPAIKLANDGFPISAKLSSIILDKYEMLSVNPDASKIFLLDMLPPPEDTILKNPQLASSMNLLIKKGAEEFYNGSIATAIVKTMSEVGGVITADDLKKYKPEYRHPVFGTYRGYQIISAAPSSGGGTHLVELLNILEGYNLKNFGHNSAGYIHTLAEAIKIVLADKSEYMCDPAFDKVPVAKLTDKSYAKNRREFIQQEKARFDYQPGFPDDNESGSTTHLSVVDKDRNIVALTQSINLWFSNGIVAEGTGILLNNHIADFASKPGLRNSIEPFKRPVSSIAPTIVLKEGKPFLTIGTPGGSRIIGALTQIIVNLIDFNMSIDEAIEAPRIHAIGKYLYLEGRIDSKVIEGLKVKGHNIKIREKYDSYFGGAQGILIQEDGKLYGGADSRRDGVAVGY